MEALKASRWWSSCLGYPLPKNFLGNPAGGAYDAPPDPVVGWGGDTPSPWGVLEYLEVEKIAPDSHKSVIFDISAAYI